MVHGARLSAVRPEDTSALEDVALVERCLAGERRAFDDFYRLHVARLYKLSCSLVGNGTDAEDVVQMTFAEACRSLRRFNGRSRVSTWLAGIAVRIAANQRRGLGRRSRLLDAYGREPPTSPGDPEAQAAGKESWRRFCKAVDALPEKKRVPFVLYYVEGLLLGEIAEIVRASVQTTFARVRSARDEIVLILGKEAQ
jgi:RNA polymerase sigma-70 factor, ECF subfamily